MIIMTPLLKNLLILLLLIGLGALGYFLFFSEGNDSIVTSSATGSSVDSQAAFQTREFRRILNELNTIDLDIPALQDPDFLNLTDHAQPIPERPFGRENPFAVE